MTIISERLQHLRLMHGYTQTDLARTMGVTRRAVYAWEHDTRIVSLYLFVTLVS